MTSQQMIEVPSKVTYSRCSNQGDATLLKVFLGRDTYESNPRIKEITIDRVANLVEVTVDLNLEKFNQALDWYIASCFVRGDGNYVVVRVLEAVERQSLEWILHLQWASVVLPDNDLTGTAHALFNLRSCSAILTHQAPIKKEEK